MASPVLNPYVFWAINTDPMSRVLLGAHGSVPTAEFYLLAGVPPSEVASSATPLAHVPFLRGSAGFREATRSVPDRARGR